MNYEPELYRIASEVHKGADDDYIRELCAELAADVGTTEARIYHESEQVYIREFERAQ